MSPAVSNPTASREPRTALVTGASALVSGATGLLGARVAALLVERGYRVRALARATSDVRRLRELGVEVALGDVTDRASLTSAMAGQRLVVHSAGKVSDFGPRREFFRVNAEGTANVIAACAEAGVERLVHISSLTVLGLPRDGRRIDEESPCAERPADAYTASKLTAERLARAAHGQGGLGVTVIRPGVIWGPGDVTIVPRFVSLLRAGALPYVAGGHNLLGLSHVDNLAVGVVQAALAKAAAGQLYHLTDGEEVSAREVLDELARRAGAAPPRRSLPFWLVLGAAGLVELSALAARRRPPPPMTRYGVRLVACDCRYDLGRARRDLGYNPRRTFREAVRELDFGSADAT